MEINNLQMNHMKKNKKLHLNKSHTSNTQKENKIAKKKKHTKKNPFCLYPVIEW